MVALMRNCLSVFLICLGFSLSFEFFNRDFCSLFFWCGEWFVWFALVLFLRVYGWFARSLFDSISGNVISLVHIPGGCRRRSSIYKALCWFESGDYSFVVAFRSLYYKIASKHV